MRKLDRWMKKEIKENKQIKDEEQTMTIPGFHVTSRHHKIPLNSRCHFFLDSRNGSSAWSYSQVRLSSHNFGEVAVIKKCKYFQN